MSVKTMLVGFCSTLMMLSFTCQGAEKGDKAHGDSIDQRAKKWEERIDHRIDMIKERLAKHTNAPAAVKADADKLLNDLTTAKGDIEKLVAASEAHNKSEMKTDRAALKRDHQTIKADREALEEAVHSLKGKHR